MEIASRNIRGFGTDKKKSMIKALSRKKG